MRLNLTRFLFFQLTLAGGLVAVLAGLILWNEWTPALGLLGISFLLFARYFGSGWTTSSRPPPERVEQIRPPILVIMPTGRTFTVQGNVYRVDFRHYAASVAED